MWPPSNYHRKSYLIENWKLIIENKFLWIHLNKYINNQNCLHIIRLFISNCQLLIFNWGYYTLKAINEEGPSIFLFKIFLIVNCTLSIFNCFFGQALGLLVPVSWMCHHTYTSGLSPCRLHGALLLSNGISNLEVGFTLRCFQRLSRPHVATQLCHWRDNWCTSGASIPVLSY